MMDEERNDKSILSDSFSFWSQWQLLDSVLSTGGFAHSNGLEAAVQPGLIFGPEDLRKYVVHVLENTGSSLLSFVHAATMSPDMQTWQKIDQLLDATPTNEVSRKASIAQGSSLMRVAAAVFSEVPSIKMMRDALWEVQQSRCTMLPSLGSYVGFLGLMVKLLREPTCS